MPAAGEHRTVQSRILRYAQGIGRALPGGAAAPPVATTR